MPIFKQNNTVPLPTEAELVAGESFEGIPTSNFEFGTGFNVSYEFGRDKLIAEVRHKLSDGKLISRSYELPLPAKELWDQISNPLGQYVMQQILALPQYQNAELVSAEIDREEWE